MATLALLGRIEKYHAAASTFLEQNGFRKVEAIWRRIESQGLVDQPPFTIELPSSFPLVLPTIRVDVTRIDSPIPHVDVSGKVCYAPDSNTLIDYEDIPRLLTECLTRATEVVRRGICGDNKQDLIAEFAAYWDLGAESLILCMADLTVAERPLALFDIRGSQNVILNDTAYLVCDNIDAGARWLKRLGMRTPSVMQHASAYHIHLNSPLSPPNVAHEVDHRWMEEEINKRLSAANFENYERWKQDINIEQRFVIASFLHVDSATVSFAFELQGVSESARKAVTKGWRPKNYDLALRNFLSKQSFKVRRLNLKRINSEFLLKRGGGNELLNSKAVVVVGCGAVGSRIAELLALVGVGHLHLIDSQPMAEENIYRHVLGAESISIPKVKALAELLEKRFPSLVVSPHVTTIQESLSARPDIFQSADGIIFATGEETVERMISAELPAHLAIVHAWIEVHGIAYHILSIAKKRGPGCFNCLFDRQNEILRNRASVLAPNQNFQQSMTGCAGLFTPFSALTVGELANESVESLINALLGTEKRNLLITRYKGASEDLLPGIKLAKRAARFQPGERKTNFDFFRADCDCCGSDE